LSALPASCETKLGRVNFMAESDAFAAFGCGAGVFFAGAGLDVFFTALAAGFFFAFAAMSSPLL
jgi:hypothetical protein